MATSGKSTPALLFPVRSETDRIKLNLGARLGLLVLSVILCVSIITTWISIRHLRGALSAGAGEMAQTMGQIVAISAAYQGFFDVDNRLLEQYVNFAAGQDNVRYAAIVGPRDEVTQTGLTSGQLQRMFDGQPPYPPERVHHQEQDIVLDDPVGKIGRIYLGISREGIALIENRLIRLQIYFTATITVIFLLLTWALIHSVTRPLTRLTEKTREMGEGILDRPLNVTGKDEVGRLAGSIERMRDNLHRKILTLAFLGRVSHNLNAIRNLDQAIRETRKELLHAPLWPWYELGIALVGRGGKDHPRDQFVYHRLIPEPAPEEARGTLFTLPETPVAEVVTRKEAAFREVPSNLIAARDGFSLYLKERDISSSIAMPLLVKGRALGVLYAGFRDRSSRDREVQFICQSLADELARAVEGIYLLSDLRESLASLRDAHQKLKGLDNLKAEFITSISKELRTPLVSMTGYLHLMLEEKLGKLSDLQREGLEVSVKSLERLTALIEKMLFFAAQHQERELKLSEVSVPNLLRQGARLMESAAGERKIRIEVDVPEDLPLIRADEDSATQVLVSLLDNAVKFSPEGGIIRLRARRGRNRSLVEFQVIDRGPGIPSEAQAKIFDKFWQGEPPEGGHRSGMGLGLTLARKIVEEHGGTITVFSRPGQGTTITFTLPTAPETSRS